MPPKKKKKEIKIENFEDLKEALGTDSVEDVKEFVSTGSTILDYSIANREGGGVPVGRITEIFGENQAGKSLIATHLLVNTQKAGGIAVYIDTEHDVDKQFTYRIGLCWDSLIYKEYLESIEEVIDYIEKVIVLIRTKYKDVLVTIVWDSVAATKARAENEQEFNPAKNMGLHARLMSAGLRKLRSMIRYERMALICTNQTRHKIGVMFGDPTTTAHGKALSFYSSVRINIARTKKLEVNGQTVGMITRARVVKNKVGPAWREAYFPVLYAWGVDDEKSILDFLTDVGIVSGSTWKIIKVKDKEYRFQGKTWRGLLEKEEEVRKYVFQELDKHMVMKFDKRPEELKVTDSILDEVGES